MARTSSSIRPSDKSTREPGSTSRARPEKSVEMRLAEPATARGVMVSRLPFLSSTGVPFFNRPVRIFGPCRSCKIQIVRFSLRAASRNLLDPSRMLGMSSVREVETRDIHSEAHQIRDAFLRIQAGPIVQTIFARRPQETGNTAFGFMSAVSDSHRSRDEPVSRVRADRASH